MSNLHFDRYYRLVDLFDDQFDGIKQQSSSLNNKRRHWQSRPSTLITIYNGNGL
jgi:hypothetical protein